MTLIFQAALVLVLFPLSSPLSGSSQVTQNLNAQAIISHWREAVGGAQVISRIHTIYRVSESDEDGLLGTREEWITSRMQRREMVDHRHDHSVTVFNGKRAWLNDWNGKTQQLHGNDVSLVADLAILHSFAALRDEAGPAEFLGDDSSHKLLILRFSPEIGFPITYYLDAGTYLPVRAELPAFDGREIISFSDWREVHGLKVAFAEKQQDPVNTTELHLKQVSFNPRQRVSFSRPVDSSNDAFFLTKTPVPVPFNFENLHVLVPTYVDGIGPTWFILDTGANYNILNQSRLDQFHLQAYGSLQTEGGANSTSGSYLEKVTLRVGGVETRNQHAAVLPLTGLEKVFGLPLGGMLGYDFISRFVVTLDYRAKTLSFSDPRKFQYHGPGAAVPLLMQGSEPYLQENITVKGETIPALFVLDVGAADTINLTTGFVKMHNLVERAGDPMQKPKTLAGSEKEFFGATTVRGLIDKVQLGPYTLNHVIGNLSVGTRGAYASSMFSGTIGETLLSRFDRMILDYDFDRMILEPGPGTNAPFEERRSFGLTLLSGGPDYKVFQVTAVGADTPAAKAGFEKGDVIAAVDDTPASDMTLEQLHELLERTGKQHVFTVQRKSGTMKLQATVETVPISGLK
jgi:hypothetical protein